MTLYDWLDKEKQLDNRLNRYQKKLSHPRSYRKFCKNVWKFSTHYQYEPRLCLTDIQNLTFKPLRLRK